MSTVWRLPICYVYHSAFNGEICLTAFLSETVQVDHIVYSLYVYCFVLCSDICPTILLSFSYVTLLCVSCEYVNLSVLDSQDVYCFAESASKNAAALFLFYQVAVMRAPGVPIS